MPVAFRAAFCHCFSMAQWLDVTPYSSNRHGFPAAAQAAACEVIQSLPQSLVVPPASSLVFCFVHGSGSNRRSYRGCKGKTEGRTAIRVEMERSEIDGVDG